MGSGMSRGRCGPAVTSGNTLSAIGLCYGPQLVIEFGFTSTRVYI